MRNTLNIRHRTSVGVLVIVAVVTMACTDPSSRAMSKQRSELTTLQRQYDLAILACSDSSCLFDVSKKYAVQPSFEKVRVAPEESQKLFLDSLKKRIQFRIERGSLPVLEEHYGDEFAYVINDGTEKAPDGKLWPRANVHFYTKIDGVWKVGIGEPFEGESERLLNKYTTWAGTRLKELRGS